jgi:hypothetical protein
MRKGQMNCPICKHKNRDDATLCESCYFNFPAARTSKLAILSLVLGISSLFLFAVTGLPAIILGNISNIRIKRSKGKLKGRLLALSSIIISVLFMFAFFMVWRIDATLIPNDYTIKDIRSAPPEDAESYQLLLRLTERNNNFIERSKDSNNPEIGLSKEDISFINKFVTSIHNNTFKEIQNTDAEQIKLAWRKTGKAREVIHQINNFTEVADLFGQEQSHEIRVYPLGDFVSLYMAYAYILNTPEEIENFTIDLVEMDSVIRKLSINARTHAVKVGCYVCLENNIITANDIANKTIANKESIKKLAEHFISLTKEELTLRNAILFEYLRNKNQILYFYDHHNLGKTPLLKKNSVLRWYRNLHVRYLKLLPDNDIPKSEILSVWPTIYPFKDYAYKKSSSTWNLNPIPLHYRIYNPLGSSLANIKILPYDIPNDKISRLKTRNELLKFILKIRLGEETVSNPDANSDQFIINIEDKTITSQSIDKKTVLRYEVKLPINPKVLGLNESGLEN